MTYGCAARARYGTVIREYKVRSGQRIVVVRMDHPQIKRPIRVLADDVTVL